MAKTEVFRNWTYDIGSSATEVGDKYIVGLFVSPALLVVYFFMRRASAAAAIVLEPFYANRYKLFITSGRTRHEASERSTLSF